VAHMCAMVETCSFFLAMRTGMMMIARRLLRKGGFARTIVRRREVLAVNLFLARVPLHSDYGDTAVALRSQQRSEGQQP